MLHFFTLSIIFQSIVPFNIQIVGEQQFDMQQPVKISIIITNNSERPILIPLDVLPFLTFKVWDQSGKLVKPKGVLTIPEFDYIPFNTLLSGDEWKISINLKKFYPLERHRLPKESDEPISYSFVPGTYKLNACFNYPSDGIFRTFDTINYKLGSHTYNLLVDKNNGEGYQPIIHSNSITFTIH